MADREKEGKMEIHFWCPFWPILDTSAISRAILKPVYWFGIPNSRPPNSQKLKINLSKNRQMTVHALVPQCAEPQAMFWVIQNAK